MIEAARVTGIRRGLSSESSADWRKLRCEAIAAPTVSRDYGAEI
jgi:hypothetical protein